MIKQLKKTGVFLTCLVLMLQACNLKDKFKNDNPIATNQVTASIIGVVKDELGQAIPNTTVMIGANTVMSDANGIYIFNKIDCNQKATTVRFSKQGYFNGFKTLSVQANEKHIANVSLMKKENPQTLNAQTGGTVNSGNGIMITFPANALVNKNTGAVYNGQANVFIKKIDPTTELGQKTMPGNLTGLNTNSQEMLLQSFGMLAAEIEDNNGNLLQIATGKEATISSEIPASLLAQAKSTIPLWYFDETKMQWKEEGSATLNGSKYEGNVKHFSFWNCDQPNASINLEFTLKDQNGNPLSGYYVTLKNNSNNSVAGGTTNSAGWIGGMVYPNTALTLNVFNSSCGNIPFYSQTINTGSSNVNLGNVIVNTNTASNPSSIQGVLLDCNNLPITNSIIYVLELELFITPNNLGNFSHNFPCTPSSAFTFLSYDLTTNMFNSTSYTLNTGTNNLGFISICGVSSPFLNVTIKNLNSNITQILNFTTPGNYIASTNNPFGLAYTNFHISATEDTLQNSKFFELKKVDSLISTNLVKDFGCNLGNAIFSDHNFDIDTLNSTIDITTLQAYPGFIEGTFDLKLTGIPSGQPYSAIGNFKAPRVN